MFNTNTIAKLQAENVELKERVENYKLAAVQKTLENDAKVRELQFEIDNGNTAEVNELREKLVKTEAKVDIAEARADQLEKAFGEIGFDVKDTKDMMNKLIDALSTKSANVNINNSN